MDNHLYEQLFDCWQNTFKIYVSVILLGLKHEAGANMGR